MLNILWKLLVRIPNRRYLAVEVFGLNEWFILSDTEFTISISLSITFNILLREVKLLDMVDVIIRQFNQTSNLLPNVSE